MTHKISNIKNISTKKKLEISKKKLNNSKKKLSSIKAENKKLKDKLSNIESKKLKKKKLLKKIGKGLLGVAVIGSLLALAKKNGVLSKLKKSNITKTEPEFDSKILQMEPVIY